MPKVILNMIVKDESHVILETLENILPHIDYYVICDTGSSDNTEQIIKEFFDAHNVQGEIHHHEWKNFGHNRTLALEACKGKGEYILVIDADDVIIGDFKLPKLTEDSYLIKIGKDFTYWRKQIFKNECGWKYAEPLHEYPYTDKQGATEVEIEGDYYLDSRRLGSRSKDPLKYLKDAQVLEDDLKLRPNNPRNWFYLGQSYVDHNTTESIEKGIEAYKKRIELGGWYEEVYYSYYRIGYALERLDRPWEEVEVAYLKAYEYCKNRTEPICKIAQHYNREKNWKKAYEYAKLGSSLKFPTECKLFIDKITYDFYIWFELAIAAYNLGKYIECYKIYQKLLSEKNIPDNFQKHTENNMNMVIEKLKHVEKQNIVIQTGYTHVRNDIKFINLVNTLSIINNVYLVGHYVDMLNFNKENIYHTTNDNLKHIKNSSTILYNDLSYVLENNNGPIYLYQNLEYFNINVENASIKVTNTNFLNKILARINKIIMIENRIEFIKNYGIDNSKISNSLDNLSGRFKYTVHSIPLNNNNNFELVAGKYITNIKNNNITNINKSIIYDFYANMKVTLNNEIGNYYYLEYLEYIQDYDECVKILLPLVNENKFYNYKLAEYYNKLGKYHESINLCNKMRKDKDFNNMKKYVNTIFEKNVDHVKDEYLKYPKKKIAKINPNKSSNVIFSMTTCKRYELFEKTINSFLNCCDDYNLIGTWLCVDDNSSEEDREKMKSKYPFFTFIFKTPEQKGHYISMNMIREFVIDNNAQYLLHMEDDFHFVHKKNYITKSINVFNDDEEIGQVLFNKNYAEVELFKRPIPGGYDKVTKTGMTYTLHEHFYSHEEKYNECLKKYPNQGTSVYWPHFSFRPSIVKVDVYKTVGLFSNTPHFEMAYSKEYKDYGFKSAFLDMFSCIHIGKKTWETGENSYTINKTNQFSINNSDIMIKVLRNDLLEPEQSRTAFKQFKENALKHLPFYDTMDWTVKENYNDKFELFLNNSFNYRRDIASNIIKQMNVVSSFDSKYLLVMFEDVSFNDNFTLDNLDNLFIDCDVVILGRYANGQVAGYIIKDKLSVGNIYNSVEDLFANMVIKDVDMISGNDYVVPELPNIDGFKFYSELDSYGCDIGYYDKTVEELTEIARNDPKCVAFNTNGWVKYKVQNENEFVKLYKSDNVNQGLYVKM